MNSQNATLLAAAHKLLTLFPECEEEVDGICIDEKYASKGIILYSEWVQKEALNNANCNM